MNLQQVLSVDFVPEIFKSYNKNILPLREKFFEGVDILSIRQLVDDLQYETCSYKTNFRWGQRYYNKNEEKFAWISSINGKIQTTFFDRRIYQPVTYQKQVFFDNKTIDEHCFSHLKHKRKIGFYYKLDPYNKSGYDNYKNGLYNVYFMNKKTYGLSQKSKTDVVWFDLDNHKADIQNQAIEKLKNLMEELEISLKDFLYIEANYFTGGIHCAIKLPFEVKNPEFFKNLEKTLGIECNFQTKLLRLPLSFEYLPLRRDINLENKREFTDNDFEKTYSETRKNMNFNTIKFQFDEFGKIIEKNKLHESFIRLRKELIKKEEEKKNKVKLYWSTPQQLFSRIKNTKIKNKELYTIRYEHRWDTFKKLIPYLKHAGKSLEEVYEILQLQNIDSKDMNNFDKLKKEIKTFYNNIKIAHEVKGVYQHNISNQSFLQDITKKFFDNEDFQRYLTERFIEKYVKVRNYKNNSVSKEKYNILLKQIPYFIKEIIGKMYYDVKNPKEFKNNKLNHYLGFQLSDNHLRKIQEQSIIDLKLEDNPLNRTSLQYLKKALLEVIGIEEIKNLNNNKKNWIKGSCKSFRIRSIYDIEEVLRHFYNSCFRDIVTKNFIINKKNLYTLYISLIDNYEIIALEDVLFIKSHIPIINDG